MLAEVIGDTDVIGGILVPTDGSAGDTAGIGVVIGLIFTVADGEADGFVFVHPAKTAASTIIIVIALISFFI